MQIFPVYLSPYILVLQILAKSDSIYFPGQMLNFIDWFLLIPDVHYIFRIF